MTIRMPVITCTCSAYIGGIPLQPQSDRRIDNAARLGRLVYTGQLKPHVHIFWTSCALASFCVSATLTLESYIPNLSIHGNRHEN